MPYLRKKDKSRNDAKWRKKNYKRMSAVDREWHRTHRSQHNESTRRHGVRKKKAKGSHTPEQWSLLKIKYGRKCLGCRRRVKLTRDHVVPISRGGTDNIVNIQPLCRPCNARKGNRAVIDYRV